MFAHVSIGADTSISSTLNSCNAPTIYESVIKCSHKVSYSFHLNILNVHICNRKCSQGERVSSREVVERKSKKKWNFDNGFVCVIFNSVYCKHERILKHIDFGNYLKRNDFVHTTDINKTKIIQHNYNGNRDYFSPRTHIKTLTCTFSVLSHIAKAFKRLKFSPRFSLIRQVHCFSTF